MQNISFVNGYINTYITHTPNVSINFQMRITKMKLLQFATASIVDANTGQGFTHRTNPIDYVASAQTAHTVRTKSIVALYRLVKEQVAIAISSYRAHTEKQLQVAALAKLDDRLLKDIGLFREDVYAVQSGRVNMEQIQSEHRANRQHRQSGVSKIARVDQQTLRLDPVNEAVYTGAKCA